MTEITVHVCDACMSFCYQSTDVALTWPSKWSCLISQNGWMILYRPLIPGLTKHNWEKMLQQALCNSLPPPDFEKLLKKCL
jgi:hypothetical protein